MSLRHRARPLSAQTRGPYSVHPWSCCCRKHPCFTKLPEGHLSLRTPPRGWWNKFTNVEGTICRCCPERTTDVEEASRRCFSNARTNVEETTPAVAAAEASPEDVGPTSLRLYVRLY